MSSGLRGSPAGRCHTQEQRSPSAPAPLLCPASRTLRQLGGGETCGLSSPGLSPAASACSAPAGTFAKAKPSAVAPPFLRDCPPREPGGVCVGGPDCPLRSGLGMCPGGCYQWLRGEAAEATLGLAVPLPFTVDARCCVGRRSASLGSRCWDPPGGTGVLCAADYLMPWADGAHFKEGRFLLAHGRGDPRLCLVVALLAESQGGSGHHMARTGSVYSLFPWGLCPRTSSNKSPQGPSHSTAGLCHTLLTPQNGVRSQHRALGNSQPCPALNPPSHSGRSEPPQVAAAAPLRPTGSV